MSRHKDDRKFHPETGRHSPAASRATGGSPDRREAFTRVMAAALREGFGHTGSAIKTVAVIADANERAVRNWFEAKNGPSGMHLVSLIQHSDHVLEALLTLAGRAELVERLALTELCAGLRELLERLDRAASAGEDRPGGRAVPARSQVGPRRRR